MATYIHLPTLCFLLISLAPLAKSSNEHQHLINKINPPIINKFESEEDVAVALADYISTLSDKYITEKDSFSIVLSGGSLIDTMRKLTESPHNESVSWSKWLVFWVDERVVPLTDPQSNYKLANDGFMSKVGIPKENIFAINDELSPEDASDEYEALLKALVKYKRIGESTVSGYAKFDLMLIGMGPDGHVASMFPGHPQRFEKKRWATFIKDSPKPPPERITMTFPVINSASDIALVITGAELANATRIALGRCADCPVTPLLPVQMVSPEGQLAWFLDKDAACF